MLDEMGTPKVSGVSSSPPWICTICGDWASGNHYGALTCFGCKGFFLRAVRSKRNLVCLEDGNCEITKDKRKQCRYCRLQMCLKAGMKKEAVKQERWGEMSRGKKKTKTKDCGSNTDQWNQSHSLRLTPNRRPRDNAVVTFLINVEYFARAAAKVVEPSYWIANPHLLKAGPADIEESFMRGLHEVVEWAKQIPTFKDLNLQDQLCILRTHICDLLILEWVRRSLHKTGCLVTANGKITSVENAPDISRKAFISRILDELVEPCKSLNLDETDFACLKGLIFFDPHVEGIGKEGKDSVGKTQYQMQLILEEYTRDELGKLSSLLMLLPTLFSIRRTMVEMIRSTRTAGHQRVAKASKRSGPWRTVNIERFVGA